jgi:L-serine dehydratase
MRAANEFVLRLRASGRFHEVARVRVDLYGSLAATGHGHGTLGAIVLGLRGEQPESVDPAVGAADVEETRASGVLLLGGAHEIAFENADIRLNLRDRLDFHSNGLRFEATSSSGDCIESQVYFSIGGGFIVDEDEVARIQKEVTEPESSPSVVDESPFPFSMAADLVATARRTGMTIGDLVLANELSMRNEVQIRNGLLGIWKAMSDCIELGCATEGELPGGLRVQRRAPAQRALLAAANPDDPLRAMEWATTAALAVNEQNAAGGRVVTAPTNGAAGIIPAVIDYYLRFVPGANDDGVIRMLLVAAGIGTLFKANASISGAEVGCQGEVGSASAMAAAGLAEVLGGSPEQVEYAAEIALEHNLGLTCDPVGGLVQIPCIERNAVGAIKAITAARMALRSNGTHLVSLDDAIETMRRTGADMHSKYKETAQGGLALTLAQIEC